MEYKRRNNLSRIAATGTAVLAAGSLTGCVEDQYASWMNTDGAAGRINMEAVKDALEKCKGVSEFEKRVNEIYEGENIVLIQCKDKGNGQKEISGWEDLDKDKKVTPAKDDKLFSATVGEKDYKIRGAGVNSHYRHGGAYTMTDMLMFHWMMNSFHSPMYMTPRSNVTIINNHRSSYRRSASYNNQRSANKGFQQRAKATNPSKYASASANKSASRNAFNATKQATFARTASRSSGGRSSGGFRGGS